ncbi:MAG TPA: hypothetical protein VEX86_15895 [Longimicrobium sp.]|nr:hypothetical protein [Longimicrobium sp.]
MANPIINEPRLTAAYEKMLERVGRLEGVLGVDIGFLYENGRPTDELGIRVFSSEERWEYLRDAVPPSIDDVKVSHLVSRFEKHESPRCASLPGEPPRKKRVDPIQPGVSVRNLGASAGTIGLIVDHATKGRCILSCAHVLTGGGVGAGVVQPAGGLGSDEIASLHDSFDDEDGDAAIAILSSARRVLIAQLGTDVVISTVRTPQIGEIVTKSGVGTGVTCGKVDGGGRYLTGRGASLKDDGTQAFRIVPLQGRGRRVTSNFSDSGSVWYAHADKAGVGLHMQGARDLITPGMMNSIACLLPTVLTRLQATPA